MNPGVRKQADDFSNGIIAITLISVGLYLFSQYKLPMPSVAPNVNPPPAPLAPAKPKRPNRPRKCPSCGAFHILPNPDCPR